MGITYLIKNNVTHLMVYISGSQPGGTGAVFGGYTKFKINSK
jgi:hypothetical protein